MVDTCCQLDTLAEELGDLSLDPALEDCCRRDLEQQASSARLRSALLSRDCTTLPSKLRSQAVALRELPAGALEMTQSQQRGQQAPGDEVASTSSSLGGDDDVQDTGLEALRQQRMRQMMQQARKQQHMQQSGYGVLNDLNESRLLALADELGGRLVCHAAVEGLEACNQLDEHLTTLAHEYTRTYFARMLIGRGSKVAAQLQLQAGPALLCFNDGAIVGKGPVAQFTNDGNILEELVDAYLRRLHMLSHRVESSSRRSKAPAAEADSGDEDEDAQDAADDWQQPCEQCGRTYPHEHVRGTYQAHAGSDDDVGDW